MQQPKHAPRVQDSKFSVGDPCQQGHPTLVACDTPTEASRLDARPATYNEWGFASGEGYATSRLAVPVGCAGGNGLLMGVAIGLAAALALR